MSLPNSELKYRLQRLEAQRAVIAETNAATQKMEQDVHFTTADNAAQIQLDNSSTKHSTPQNTVPQRATFQPNESTMIVSSVPADVLEPKRTGSKFSNFFTASDPSSKNATPSGIYHAISKNLQAVLGSINEWMNNRSADSNPYKIDNHTTENYTVPMSDNYEVSELVHAAPVTNQSNFTQYCVSEFDPKTTPTVEATTSSYAVNLNPLPNLNKRQCVDGVSKCTNILNEYTVKALSSSTACTCTVDLSSDIPDENKACSESCKTQCDPKNLQMMYSVENEHNNEIIKTTTDKPYLNPYHVQVHVFDVVEKSTNSCNETYCEAFAGKKMRMHKQFAERLSCINEIDEVHSVK